MSCDGWAYYLHDCKLDKLGVQANELVGVDVRVFSSLIPGETREHCDPLGLRMSHARHFVYLRARREGLFMTTAILQARSFS